MKHRYKSGALIKLRDNPYIPGLEIGDSGIVLKKQSYQFITKQMLCYSIWFFNKNIKMLINEEIICPVTKTKLSQKNKKLFSKQFQEDNKV